MTLPDSIVQDDPQINRVKNLLERAYKKRHPQARIDVYKRNEFSIRVRVVNPDFEDKDVIEREEEVWKVLKGLPDEVFTNITLLVLLTPKELQDSPANLIFENPEPSPL